MSKRKRKKQGHRPLTEAQKQAAQMTFDGQRTGQIAAALHVHRSSVWRWRQRPDFQKEISRVHDRYVRERRRAYLREWHNSPEYKRQKARAYAARRKLKKLSEKLDNAKTAREHQILWEEYQKTYNEAYFAGKTPAEFLRLCTRDHENSYTSTKARETLKYIIEIV